MRMRSQTVFFERKQYSNITDSQARQVPQFQGETAAPQYQREAIITEAAISSAIVHPNVVTT